MHPASQPGLTKPASVLDSAIFESSPDCVKLLDLDGRLLAMNRKGMCAMQLDDFAAIAGAPWQSLWPAASAAAIERALEVARGGGSGSFAAFCPTARGTPKWWEVVVTPVRGRDGAVAQLLSVSRDVTASHAALARLHASEARYRSLVTATAAIVWTGPAHGEFETEQAGWAAYTGQSFEQYRGWGWLDAVHPDDRAGTAARWRAAVACGAIFEAEHRLRRADGVYRHMSVRAVPVFDDVGTILEWVGTHTDVTRAVEAHMERERLLGQIQAANDLMADVFRQAPAFMCVLTGPEHVYQMVNQRYRELVGREDLVGKRVRDALPELAEQGILKLLDQVYATGEPYAGTDVPLRLRSTDDVARTQHYIDFSCTPLRNGEGEVTGILVHGVDQTDRKLAEIELFESRDRLQKIVSQAATGVVQTDAAGRFTLVNAKYCDMLGYTQDELLGRSVLEVTAPDSIETTLDAVRQVKAGAANAVIEKRYLRRDGSLLWATSSLTALRDAAGAYQGVVAIVIDMTERMQAVARLRASEERYRTLFTSVDQGFCVIEMQFGPHGEALDYRFLEMNPVFERHTGLSDAIGRTARELVPQLDQFWFDTYGKVARTGQPIRFEHRAEAMGRWFDVYATPLGGEGSARVALLFSDITARKRSDEHLRTLAADLAQSDRRKTEFLATLAHELRNPLAPIRSGLALLRMGRDGAAAARIHDMMDRQVGNMVHLIDDLLDIARISGGKLELRRERVALREVLAGAVETSLPLIDAGRHQLVQSLPTEELVLDADRTRIGQVVANLLNNAAKYTPAGGRIELSARRDGNEALIAVRDTGIGLPPESLEAVFDMFNQIGRHTDRSHGGLGIGLSLVRRLVEMHGGAVTASSEGLGRGSTFTVRLPLAAGAAGQPEAGAASGPAQPLGGGVHVLVVDDNVDAGSALGMLLEASGHAVRVGHDGWSALRLADEFSPHVVFLDIGMPGMDGYQTARALRASARGAELLIVALTGWGAESDRQKSRDAGFDFHLTKPADAAAVNAILAQAQAAT